MTVKIPFTLSLVHKITISCEDFFIIGRSPCYVYVKVCVFEYTSLHFECLHYLKIKWTYIRIQGPVKPDFSLFLEIEPVKPLKPVYR